MRKSFATVTVMCVILAAVAWVCHRAGFFTGESPSNPAEPIPPISLPLRDGMVEIPASEFIMGSATAPFSEERPAHRVRVDAFWLDIHEVTNAQFAIFIDETGYRTTAEDRGWSYVFDYENREWVKRPDADWRRPQGGESTIIGRELHPVVHVSHYDAVAYCRWAGKRLPTEAQWECAARSGLIEKMFPWGDEERSGGRCRANYWQGWFPRENREDDGYRRSAPVKSFPPNRFGLYDLMGNVWEWCSDRFDAEYYQRSPTENPTGSQVGDEFVQRGGSYLSAANAKPGFSLSMRGKARPELSFEDVGFRCVQDRK